METQRDNAGLAGHDSIADDDVEQAFFAPRVTSRPSRPSLPVPAYRLSTVPPPSLDDAVADRWFR